MTLSNATKNKRDALSGFLQSYVSIDVTWQVYRAQKLLIRWLSLLWFSPSCKTLIIWMLQSSRQWWFHLSLMQLSVSTSWESFLVQSKMKPFATTIYSRTLSRKHKRNLTTEYQQSWRKEDFLERYSLKDGNSTCSMSPDNFLSRLPQLQ